MSLEASYWSKLGPSWNADLEKKTWSFEKEGDGNSESDSSPSLPAMTSTMLPFLYQTRTIQQNARHVVPRLVNEFHLSTPWQLGRGRFSRSKRSTDPVPFELAPDQIPTLRDKEFPKSTMTSTERKVFDDIFGDIKKKRLQSAAPRTALEVLAMSQAAATTAKTNQESARIEAAMKREKMLHVYPPSLRRAAELALGLQEDDHPEQVELEAKSEASQNEHDRGKLPRSTADQEALLALHRTERAHFIELIKSATTDQDLWAILKRVFDMAPRLGIADGEAIELRKQQHEIRQRNVAARQVQRHDKLVKKMMRVLKRAEKPHDRADAVREVELVYGLPDPRKELAEPQEPELALELLDMDTHGPLYSVHLLDGLRHFDRGFASPSPLALGLLSRIVEIGIASRILGASTRFYNELLSILWYRYGDTNSVLRILEEMKKSGLSGDAQTLSIIDVIVKAVRGLPRNASEGSFATILGMTPGYDSNAVAAFTHWQSCIRESLDESGDSFERTMGSGHGGATGELSSWETRDDEDAGLGSFFDSMPKELSNPGRLDSEETRSA